MALLDEIYSGGAPSPKAISVKPSPLKQQPVIPQTVQIESDVNEQHMVD